MATASCGAGPNPAALNANKITAPNNDFMEVLRVQPWMQTI